MKNLLITGAIKLTDSQLQGIMSLGYNIMHIQDERLPLNVDVSHISAVICNGLFLTNDIQLFESLEMIQLTSVGLERVPLDYISSRHIQLFNAKGVYSVPMAEWAVLRVLEFYKKSRVFDKNQKLHQWEKQRDILELTDKRAAIVGFGNVGREVAKRLHAFGVKISSLDLVPSSSDDVDAAYGMDDLKHVISQSDMVILTLPLTDRTYHLIDKDCLENFKQDAVLVNISRGGIICEDALVDKIKEKRFLGVALDVFEDEPLEIHSLLWDFDNVMVTPHNSFVSDQTNKRLYDLILHNLAYCNESAEA